MKIIANPLYLLVDDNLPISNMLRSTACTEVRTEVQYVRRSNSSISKMEHANGAMPWRYAEDIKGSKKLLYAENQSIIE